jgi:hypothetical protein
MGTTLVSEPISTQRLREAGEELFGDMVKAVVDIDKGVMAIGAELHADEEAFLLERESQQESLWGINLYTERALPAMVEFDSMINIRPRQTIAREASKMLRCGNVSLKLFGDWCNKK